jgi:hypothetical protein
MRCLTQTITCFGKLQTLEFTKFTSAVIESSGNNVIQSITRNAFAWDRQTDGGWRRQLYVHSKSFRCHKNLLKVQNIHCKYINTYTCRRLSENLANFVNNLNSNCKIFIKIKLVSFIYNDKSPTTLIPLA